MKEIVTGKQTAPHYTWGHSCDTWILSEGEGLSVKQELMPAGAAEQLHYHKKAQQFFFVLSGTASFFMDGEKHSLAAQQGITVKAGSKHFIANDTGDTLEFLVISQPGTHEDRINC
jgi:mannose-6-phosphate isomerase-like protein (cupin superfamily)